MNWTNVSLIFFREVRDQLRDRRTLFMIAVLPLLLYPLLGMSFLQISQFMREHATRVLIIGAPEVKGLPALVEGDGFSPQLPVDKDRLRVLKVTVEPHVPPDSETSKPTSERALALVQQGKYDVVVYFPADFDQQFSDLRRQLRDKGEGTSTAAATPVPDPVIYFNEAKEESGLAYRRVDLVLKAWQETIGKQLLSDSDVPPIAARPFQIAANDVAQKTDRQAALWSKVLPFVLLLWALTGAFYPAVDLCAGEKERGTLETLLSSPAERSEIVWGKLLTIMLFSIATALLNLMSMGLTGSFVFGQLAKFSQATTSFGAPPMWAIPMLVVALIPMSALFSALCLALAAFARSTKEGQYYLMPLVLITMPLTMLPMSPGVELTLGNSLIPITGVVLLLRELLEGEWMQALPFIPPVLAVTLGLCLLAVRWAADQFNSESVLFRESERFDMGLWLRRMVQDREETPGVPQAVACGVIILLLQFFMNMAMPPNQTFLVQVAVPQLVCILTPALLMTVMLTSNARRTLLLKLPSFGTMVAAVVLAVCIHPLSFALRAVVEYLYPLPPNLAEHLDAALKGTTLTQLLFCVGILPAFCEELAFRGFILSGLRHMGHKWRAIVISSLFFGIAHGLFQQSLTAALIGTVIAYVAVQTGSILPGMIFHLLHNSMQVLASRMSAEMVTENPLLRLLVNPEALQEHDTSLFGDFVYRLPVMVVAAAGVVLVLYWLHKRPYSRSQEERLQETIEEFDAPEVDVKAVKVPARS